MGSIPSPRSLLVLVLFFVVERTRRTEEEEEEEEEEEHDASLRELQSVGSRARARVETRTGERAKKARAIGKSQTHYETHFDAHFCEQKQSDDDDDDDRRTHPKASLPRRERPTV